MKKGDYVFVVKPEVMTGDKRPSLAKILHTDGDKAVVESTYRHINPFPDTGEHARWIVHTGTCIPVDVKVLQVAAKAEHKESTLKSTDLVMWIEGNTTICEGVVVNVTPKTVEILQNGSTKIKRKKKELVVKL